MNSAFLFLKLGMVNTCRLGAITSWQSAYAPTVLHGLHNFLYFLQSYSIASENITFVKLNKVNHDIFVTHPSFKTWIWLNVLCITLY